MQILYYNNLNNRNEFSGETFSGGQKKFIEMLQHLKTVSTQKRITIETIMTILLADCTDRRTDNVEATSRFDIRKNKWKINSCFYPQIVIFIFA